MSRPPMKKWELAASASEKLLKAIEAAMSTKDGKLQIAALLEAQHAVDEFCEHVNEAEECEMP